jgi:short-subunit dehydrogenase
MISTCSLCHFQYIQGSESHGHLLLPPRPDTHLAEKEARAHSLPIAASIVDISKPEDVRRAAQSAGLITILVNNAGVASVGELLQLTETQIKR